jgi:AraC-like DNA-binding protein/quercetin dioxygenase-like cupin family protein
MKDSTGFQLLRPFKETVYFDNTLYRAWMTSFSEEHTVPPHYHPDIEIVVPAGAKGETYVDGQKYELMNNEVFCVRPNAIHSYRIAPSGGGLVYVLLINVEECGRLVSGLVKSSLSDFMESLKRVPVRCRIHATEVVDSVKGLSQLEQRDHPQDVAPTFQSAMGDIEKIYSILQNISAETVSPPLEKKQDAKIRRIIDVIESLASEPTSLDEIARQSAVSKFHLCRIFKRATGMTVQAYLIDLRIRRACRMLMEEDKNVTQACFDCGFENLSYFIQVFKNKMSVPPKQWVIAEKKKYRKIRI